MKTKIINTLYSFGAAIVVFGAWAKIEHHTFADTSLTVGLLTEVGIFIIYGLQELMGKPEQTGQGIAPGQSSQEGVIRAVEDTNAILRTVYRMGK